MLFTRAARMSLLYSTIRVISPSSVLRKFTRAITVLFFLFWATIIVLKTWRCVSNTKPLLSLGRVRPMCGQPDAEIFFELISKQLLDVFICWYLTFTSRLCFGCGPGEHSSQTSLEDQTSPKAASHGFMLILVKLNHVDVLVIPCNKPTALTQE